MDASVYPRKGPIYIVRLGFYGVGGLLGAYGTAIVWSLYQTVRQSQNPFASRGSFVAALFLPNAFADPRAPLSIFLIPVLAVAGLLVGVAWALNDRVHENTYRFAAAFASIEKQTEEAATYVASTIPCKPEVVAMWWNDGALQHIHTVIDRPIMRVGRGIDNDMVVGDSHVSRKQLVIAQGEHDWHIVAEPGAMSMWLNGHEVKSAEIAFGDQVLIGYTVLRVEGPLDGSAKAEKAPILVVSCYSVRFAVPLRLTTFKLGRNHDSELYLPSPAVSRYHADLVRSDDSYCIIDRSRNGVWLGRKRVRSHVLCDGDTLTLGKPASPSRVTLTYFASFADSRALWGTTARG